MAGYVHQHKTHSASCKYGLRKVITYMEVKVYNNRTYVNTSLHLQDGLGGARQLVYHGVTYIHIANNT